MDINEKILLLPQNDMMSLKQGNACQNLRQASGWNEKQHKRLFCD